MKSRIISATIIAAISAFALVSCTAVQPIVETDAISLSATSLNMVAGDTKQLDFSLVPADATCTFVEWKSSDASVATVTSYGLVVAQKPGRAIISATTGAAKVVSSCDVTVAPRPVSGVKISPETAKVYIDASVTLTAVVEPESATDKTVVWSTEDSDIATVVDGKVTGIGPGTVKISVKTNDGGFSASCAVTVEEVDPVEPEVTTLYVKDKAGQRKVFGTKGESTASWLTYENGTAFWTANTTGAPRSAVLTTDKGSAVTITQVEAADLVGEYTFYNYSFKATGGVSKTTVVDQAGRKHETIVNFEKVANPQELNGHLHNLDLVGLYYDAKVPVSFEITKDGPKIYTYLSLDYQNVSSGDKVAIIPELTNTTSYSTGYFAPKAFGVDNCNYTWPAWGVIDLGTTPKFTLGTGTERLVSADPRYFCGFSVVKPGYAEGDYTTIYQLNYMNKWVYSPEGGAYFKKK